MEIVGYSSYSHINQEPFLRKASRAKSEVVEKAQKNRTYGVGLDTLLIFYNFETEPNEFSETDFLQEKIKVYRYNSKEQSLRVNVFVGYDELTSKSYEEQIAFYYITTMQALGIVKEKYAKRRNLNVEIDFEKLISDIQKGFLKSFTWLSK